MKWCGPWVGALLAGFLGMAPLHSFQTQDTAAPATDWARLLPSGEGKGYVVTFCTGCHSLEKVILQRRSEAEWISIVGKMVGDQGAPIAEAEQEEIIAYLARYFSPLPKTGAVSTPFHRRADSEPFPEIDWAMLLPDDSGRELVVSYCAAGCHGLDIIVKNRKTHDSWYNTVTWMTDDFKAPVAEQDVAAIVQYLSRHAGPDNPVREVPLDVNSASGRALQRLRFLTHADVSRLLQYRMRGKFESIQEVSQFLGLDAEASRLSEIYLRIQ